jgi:hypothetical protein
MRLLWLSLLVAGCSAIPPNPVEETAYAADTLGSCMTAEECAPDEYCEHGDACGAPGSCRNRPLECAEIYRPVCGCDGRTWSNDCVMREAGVSKDHDGGCANACASNADCAATQVCVTPAGSCGGAGHCDTRFLNLFCPEIFKPVCGCDGVTYSNDCVARRGGVSVDHPGECSGTTQ